MISKLRGQDRFRASTSFFFQRLTIALSGVLNPRRAGSGVGDPPYFVDSAKMEAFFYYRRKREGCPNIGHITLCLPTVYRALCPYCTRVET